MGMISMMRMKKYKHLIWGIMGMLVFLAACQPQKADPEFSALCQQNKHMWMRMEPLSDGEKTGEPDCVGCMPDGDNHICSKDEYIHYLNMHKNNPNIYK